MRLERTLDAMRPLLLAAAAGATLLFAAAPVPAADKPGFAIGERLPPAAGGSTRGFRELKWDELVPPGWDPMKGIDMRSLGGLQDNDPRASAMLEKLRQAWDNAPVRPELNNAQVRMPGFVVPLAVEGRGVREFLLVPYYGACIHTPPPPANQVVHVVMDKPSQNLQAMDTVWVSGRMQVTSTATAAGQAGYRIDAREVGPYHR